tara:strand:+ start:1335 stop:1625 length:291 start_codon:yes stop_codon:yes gene_type:complete
MKQIQNIIEKLIDELNTHENIDQYVYDLIEKIEIEIQQPIEIYRNEDRWIYDVQPSYNWTTIDQSGEKEKEKEKEKVGQIGENLQEKTLNLAKLTE